MCCKMAKHEVLYNVVQHQDLCLRALGLALLLHVFICTQSSFLSLLAVPVFTVSVVLPP